MGDFIYYGILTVIVLLIIYVSFRGTYTMFRDVLHFMTGYHFKHWYHRKMLSKPLKPAYKSILETYFTYYQLLDSESRQLFERRVQQFINMKQFIPRTRSLQVTDEMIVLISASAIQLTFGLPGIYFRHFHRILIYPDDYYSTISRKYHQGEVNRAGIIVLSWRNFLNGYSDQSDGRNLALHEMAHALLLEDKIVNGEFEFLSREYLEDWDILATQEIEKISRGKSIFRAYGASNRFEFFAVGVELFFEKPFELKSYNVRIYETLAALLNQDILRIQNHS